MDLDLIVLILISLLFIIFIIGIVLIVYGSNSNNNLSSDKIQKMKIVGAIMITIPIVFAMIVSLFMFM